MDVKYMDAPTELLKNFAFKTDLNSMLRGLNPLLGLNMGMRSRLRSIRVANNKVPVLIASEFNLIKFVLVADQLPDSARALKYNDKQDSYEFTDSLTGDPKDVLFIFENMDISKYTKALIKEKALKNYNHFYSDELSALLDSYQINNGLVYLYHNPNNELFIVNRALSPDPEDDSFFFYTKLYNVSNSVITDKTNFVEINRFDLSIKSYGDLSSADLGQMVLPVIHLKNA